MGVANKYRFGEAIPMSRADIAAGTIRLEEFDKLSETEQDKCLRRDFIWKAPNVKKLRKDGADMDLVYWQNEIRKALKAKPVQYLGVDDYKRTYVDIVSTIRDKVMNATTPGTILFGDEEISFKDWAEIQYTSGNRIERDALCAVTPSLFFVWTPDKVHTYVKRERFGYTVEETARADAEDRFKSFIYGGMCPKNKNVMAPDKIYDNDNAWQNRTDRHSYVIGSSYGMSFYYLSEEKAKQVTDGMGVVINVLSHDILAVVPLGDLPKTLQNIKDTYINVVTTTDDTSETKRKKKFVPEELAGIKQVNGTNEDSSKITPDRFLSMFQFRGGEWGNWLNENERNTNLAMCYNSFCNLADILNLQRMDVSLGQQMSIAFGSRGRSSASAHFEPGNNVINLTKMKGAGCLAHEWGHALDSYIAKKYNIPADLATEAKNVYLKPDAKNLDYSNRYYRTRDILPAEFWDVLKAIHDATEFQKGSKKFDEAFSKSGHGYWSSTCEMWARAFDCYISDKLKNADITDTYLSRGANSYHYKENDTVYRAYPVGDERVKISEAFDKLIQMIFT